MRNKVVIEDDTHDTFKKDGEAKLRHVLKCVGDVFDGEVAGAVKVFDVFVYDGIDVLGVVDGLFEIRHVEVA